MCYSSSYGLPPGCASCASSISCYSIRMGCSESPLEQAEHRCAICALNRRQREAVPENVELLGCKVLSHG